MRLLITAEHEESAERDITELVGRLVNDMERIGYREARVHFHHDYLEDEELAFDPSLFTVGELREHLGQHEYTPGELSVALAQEERNLARKGAKEALYEALRGAGAAS